MGKQKRSKPRHTKPSPSSPTSDTMPCSSGVDLASKERKSLAFHSLFRGCHGLAGHTDKEVQGVFLYCPTSHSFPAMQYLVDKGTLHSVDASERKPLSSVMDTRDSVMKMPHSHPSLAQNYNLSRSLFLKRSRHYYGHQYFRRKSGNYASTSTSHGKGTPLREERLSFKLANQCHADNGGLADGRENTFKPQIIGSRSSVMDTVSSEVVKMVCGICQKLLRRKPYSLESTLSSSELSVVAVLVCGHIYHAECLEQRTCQEHRRDPPCPMCTGLRSESEVEISRE